MSPSQPGRNGPDHAQAGAPETSIPTCTCEVTPGVPFASVNARMAHTPGPAHQDTCPLYRRTFLDPRYLEADPREAARFLAVTDTPAQVGKLAAFLDLLASIDPSLRRIADDLDAGANELRAYVRAMGEG